MTKIRVRLTQKDIDKAQAVRLTHMRSRHCPLAQMGKRLKIAPGYASMLGLAASPEVWKRMTKFAQAFDDSKKISPTSFTLNAADVKKSTEFFAEYFANL